MKYGLSLDQKKRHGSYQIVYQQCRVVGIAIFSLKSWNNSLADDHVSQSKPTTADCVQCHARGRVRWLLRGFVCLWNALRGKADG